jgi:hypothetical protein
MKARSRHAGQTLGSPPSMPGDAPVSPFGPA